MWEYNYSDELYHYGVLGMKWGKRKAKPATEPKKNWKYHKSRLDELERRYDKETAEILTKSKNMSDANRKISSLEKRLGKEYKDSLDYKPKHDKKVKIAKTVIGTTLVAGGAYAAYRYMKNHNIKFTTENKLRGKQWAAENKRLDGLMKTSMKNIESFMSSKDTKSAMDHLHNAKKASSAAAELRKDMFNTVFGPK